MVERMMYINLMGRMEDLDRVIERYVVKYDIQLEYAPRDMAEAEGLTPLPGQNPYASAKQKADQLRRITGLPWKKPGAMKGEDAASILDAAARAYEERDARFKALEIKKHSLEEYKKSLEPFAGLNFDLEKLKAFDLITCTFGKMPVSNFRQLEAFLYDDPEILFVQAERDKEYMWGMYATPLILKEKNDSIFTSLHFERINLLDNESGETFSGSPEQVIERIDERLSSILEEMNSLIVQIHDHSSEDYDRLAEAAAKANELFYVYETRKFAMKTPKDFFVFVGWMAETDGKAFQKDIADDSGVIFITDSDKVPPAGLPPTRLKNPPLIRNFEFFTAMYGMPGYGELDPTVFLAITYTLLFGFMFGDLGQGAVFVLLGLFLYKKRGMALGAIISIIGCSSMLFGALYGSVFGFEDWIDALWRRPADDINSTLFVAVGIGVFLILAAMVLNILNSVRQKNWGKLIFSPNGLAGFVFYGAVIAIVLLYMNGNISAAITLGAVFAVIPLILIAFREPLTMLMEKKKSGRHESIPMYILEIIIELFEVLLTFFTNTVSFVRVGAFALSHAGMMGVVMLLARSANDNSYNIIAVILGNIVVMALEGLVVGIQVLRLEFYEMFSRFFSGDGRAFRSYKKAK
ncbi:MAG: ATPase [Clostridiales bacterium]|jgi:V/A-type H+-transporting ATPase subunit I|nr:ATPase [Clostridiales bacterium]